MLEYLSMIFSGIELFFNVEVLISVVIGVFAGIVIGALPGLTVVMAITLALPFTFGMNPVAAIAMLICIYKGGMFGGSISAILIGTPGTAAAAADVADGYPLAKKGYAKKALDTALYSSVIADIISTIITIFASIQLAVIAVKIGPAEYFVIIAFALTIIAAVSGKSILKGLIAGGFGMLFATVGLDTMYSSKRFTFGSVNLMSGLSIVPVLVGIFAIPEIIEQLKNKKLYPDKEINKDDKALALKDNGLTCKELKPLLRHIFSGSLIGAVIGIIPGLGSEVATFVSYGRAKKTSKNPEKFGSGSLEGLAAAEAGNSGCGGPVLVPVLALGVPGSTSMAILLTALLVQGLHPGPMLFKENMDIVSGIFIAMLAANVVLLFLGKILIKYSALTLAVPKDYLFSCIFILCVFGCYAVNNSIFDIGILLVMGVVGMLMKKFDLPLPPFIIAFVLSNLFENGLRRAMIAFGGNLIDIIKRPIPSVFIVLTLIFFLCLIKKKFFRKKVKIDK